MGLYLIPCGMLLAVAVFIALRNRMVDQNIEHKFALMGSISHMQNYSEFGILHPIVLTQFVNMVDLQNDDILVHQWRS